MHIASEAGQSMASHPPWRNIWADLNKGEIFGQVSKKEKYLGSSQQRREYKPTTGAGRGNRRSKLCFQVEQKSSKQVFVQ